MSLISSNSNNDNEDFLPDEENSPFGDTCYSLQDPEVKRAVRVAMGQVYQPEDHTKHPYYKPFTEFLSKKFNNAIQMYMNHLHETYQYGDSTGRPADSYHYEAVKTTKDFHVVSREQWSIHTFGNRTAAVETMFRRALSAEGDEGIEKLLSGLEVMFGVRLEPVGEIMVEHFAGLT